MRFLEGIRMRRKRMICRSACSIAIAMGPTHGRRFRPGSRGHPDARPVTVEHIKVHGTLSKAIWKATPSTATSLSSCRPATQNQASPLSRCLRAAWLLHWRRAVDARIHVPETIEGAFAQGAKNDRRASGLQNGAQRIHVLQFGHHRRL